MYTGLPLMYYTGSYRFMTIKDFRYELALAYFMELFLQLIPMLAIITKNNDRLSFTAILDP